MEENLVPAKGPWVQSIWSTWIISTAVYSGLTLLGFLEKDQTIQGYVTGFIGLFVPYGPMSLLLLSSPLSSISIIVFVVLMVIANKKLNKKDYSLIKRIFLNLLVLLLLTTIVDLVRGTPFFSWLIFFDGGLALHGSSW